MVDESRLPPANFTDPRMGVEVTRYLREAVMSGAFRPGEKVGLEYIANQLGVSTMPVREALVTLANEGVFELQPNRGFRLAPITRSDIEDLFRVHTMATGLLAQRAAIMMSAEEVRQLRSVQEQLNRLPGKRMARAQRASQAETLNWEFHRLINNADPESNRLRWFVRHTSRFVPRSFYHTVGGWLDSTLEDHPPLLEAIETRDPDEARRRMEAHAQHAGEQILAYLEKSGMWD